jgi:hypothetical protein
MIPKNYKCPYCDLPFADLLDYHMVPVEKPYMNFFLHKDCYLKLGSEIDVWIVDNIEKVIKTYNNNR